MNRTIVFETIVLDDEQKELIRAKRFVISAQCSVIKGDNVLRGETLNISQSGLLVKFKDHPRIFSSDRIRLSIKFNNFKVNAICEVKYVKKHQMGLHILEMTSQDINRLDNLLLGLAYEQAA